MSLQIAIGQLSSMDLWYSCVGVGCAVVVVCVCGGGARPVWVVALHIAAVLTRSLSLRCFP